MSSRLPLRPDTSGMDDSDLELLASNPSWQQVLQIYLDLTAEPAERSPEQTGPRWAVRIGSLDDLEPAELSLIHGQLIAQGWLKFQFETEQTGLMYRISSEGRAVLHRIHGKSPAFSPEERMPVAADRSSEADAA